MSESKHDCNKSMKFEACFGCVNAIIEQKFKLLEFVRLAATVEEPNRRAAMMLSARARKILEEIGET